MSFIYAPCIQLCEALFVLYATVLNALLHCIYESCTKNSLLFLKLVVKEQFKTDYIKNKKCKSLVYPK